MIDRRRHHRPASTRPPVRIGAVSYLNSKPLIEGLAETAPEASLLLDYPSRLADELAAGRLDVALIPSIEAFADPDYEVVSDACVAARGPVLSVKLYSRVDPGAIRSLALDEGSRTSAALVRIILEERYAVRPTLRPLPMGSSVSDSEADAVLVIGDRAMHPLDEDFAEVWDLGEVWSNWTGLPFVFAMWVTRKGVPLDGIEDALREARDVGLERVVDIARRESDSLGISRDTAEKYLTQNLHFHLSSAERSGLRLFHQLAIQHGLAPEHSRLTFREAAPVAATIAG